MTMKWSFSYNFFVRLSLLLIIQLTLITWSIHMDAKHNVIKGPCHISFFFSEIWLGTQLINSQKNLYIAKAKAKYYQIS